MCRGWQGKDRAVPSCWLRQGPFRAAKGAHATAAAGAGSLQYLSQYLPRSPSCPGADAGALSTEPRHCVSIGPAMAGLGNARQDTLDAGEVGEGGVWSSGCDCWAGRGHEGCSGQGEGHSSNGLRRVMCWGQLPLPSSALLGARDPHSSGDMVGGSGGCWRLWGSCTQGCELKSMMSALWPWAGGSRGQDPQRLPLPEPPAQGCHCPFACCGR